MITLGLKLTTTATSPQKAELLHNLNIKIWLQQKSCNLALKAAQPSELYQQRMYCKHKTLLKS